MAGALSGSALCDRGQSQHDRHERRAQALAKRERVQVREPVVRQGRGKTAREERLRTELVGIEALTTYDSSGEREPTRVTPIGVIMKDSPSTRSSCAAGTIGCLPARGRST